MIPRVLEIDLVIGCGHTDPSGAFTRKGSHDSRVTPHHGRQSASVVPSSDSSSIRSHTSGWNEKTGRHTRSGRDKVAGRHTPARWDEAAGGYTTAGWDEKAKAVGIVTAKGPPPMAARGLPGSGSLALPYKEKARLSAGSK